MASSQGPRTPDLGPMPTSPPASSRTPSPPDAALPACPPTSSDASLAPLFDSAGVSGGACPQLASAPAFAASRSSAGWRSSRSSTKRLEAASWALWAVLVGAWCAGPLGQSWAWPFSLPANLLLWLVPAALPIALAWAWSGRTALAMALVAHAPLWAVVCSPAVTGDPGRLHAAPQAAEGPELSVLSFNVGDYRTAAEDLVAALLDCSADVVGLQELSEEQADAVASALSARFPHQALFAHGPEGRGLLSRYPLQDVSFERGGAHRRQLRARVLVEGQSVEVLVVHLSVVAALGGTAESSAQHLLEYVKREVDGPRLLIGDFNSTPTSGVAARLRQAGWIDAFEQSGRGPGFTFPVAGRYNGIPLPPFLRLDQAWCSADCEVLEARVAEDGGGDHLPLAVRLRLP